jgi:hypothetical protein
MKKNIMSLVKKTWRRLVRTLRLSYVDDLLVQTMNETHCGLATLVDPTGRFGIKPISLNSERN